MTNDSYWMSHVTCPDCHHPVVQEFNPIEALCCRSCSKSFQKTDGIWNLLPSAVANQDLKDQEKNGWTRKEEESRQRGWDPPPEHYLSLPDHPHPYYQAAAWYMQIVLAHGAPWTGKKVLELGAAECWGTRSFAEAGADAAALDYDPTRMKKGQILLDHLPISFARFTGDAENLPFADQSLDVVYCCSVLHHFFDLPKAIREIYRTLKPGGVFYGIHEAFHPPYYSEEKIQSMADDTIPNIELGINESSYPLSRYRQWFRQAGLRFEAIHPRWDVRRHGDRLCVSPGIGIHQNPEFRPLSLTARCHIPGIRGTLARLVLKTKLWKMAAHPLVFSMLRFHILNWTVKDKIIVATKPG